MTLDLNRVVPDDVLAQIKADVGIDWEADEVTVADVITSMSGIGYGGHFLETSDEEDMAHCLLGLDDDEVTAIVAARYEYTMLLAAAVEAVAWPPATVTVLARKVAEYQGAIHSECVGTLDDTERYLLVESDQTGAYWLTTGSDPTALVADCDAIQVGGWSITEVWDLVEDRERNVVITATISEEGP